MDGGDVVRRYAAVVECRCDQRPIAARHFQLPQILHAANTSACEQPHVGRRLTQAPNEIEVDTADANPREVKDDHRSHSGIGRSLCDHLGRLQRDRRGRGDHWIPIPEIEAEREALAADGAPDRGERLVRRKRFQSDNDLRHTERDCLRRSIDRGDPRVEPDRHARRRDATQE